MAGCGKSDGVAGVRMIGKPRMSTFHSESLQPASG